MTYTQSFLHATMRKQTETCSIKNPDLLPIYPIYPTLQKNRASVVFNEDKDEQHSK